MKSQFAASFNRKHEIESISQNNNSHGNSVFIKCFIKFRCPMTGKNTQKLCKNFVGFGICETSHSSDTSLHIL